MKLTEEIITSRQNRRVVEVGKLTDRKARETTKTFRFDGVKLLVEAIKNHVSLESVFLRQSDAERILARVSDAIGNDLLLENSRFFLMSDGVFDKLSEEKSPEGVISVAKYIDKFYLKPWFQIKIENCDILVYHLLFCLLTFCPLFQSSVLFFSNSSSFVRPRGY